MNLCDRIIAQVEQVFVGDRSVVRKVLLTLLAGGHVLLEDIPGVGKTTLAVALSQSLALDNKRIQFTPDVMPADVVGYSMLRPGEGEMTYQPGAVMCNFLLADEINRASSRTQSALLQAMEEHAVTVDGVTHELPMPFMVVATQNPTGSAGTQLLPDSQTDRFMVRMSIGYPTKEMERAILQRKQGGQKPAALAAIADGETLMEMRRAVAEIYIHEQIYDYILALSRATRRHTKIAQGASPRGTVALMSMSQAMAYADGRDYVVPEDVQGIYVDCMAHRMVLTQEAKRGQCTPEELLRGVLGAVKEPGRGKR